MRTKFRASRFGYICGVGGERESTCFCIFFFLFNGVCFDPYPFLHRVGNLLLEPCFALCEQLLCYSECSAGGEVGAGLGSPSGPLEKFASFCRHVLPCPTSPHGNAAWMLLAEPVAVSGSRRQTSRLEDSASAGPSPSSGWPAPQRTLAVRDHMQQHHPELPWVLYQSLGWSSGPCVMPASLREN